MVKNFKCVTHYVEDGPLFIELRNCRNERKWYQVDPVGKFGAQMKAATDWVRLSLLKKG